ncbi:MULTISPECIES: ATP-binding protein [Sphaerimonospora]|uniref:Histidine kinase/HSP90-like ATPase domain-containing protein n=2 Tax=Sphaerimonospora TaxID=1792303 RepID=A0A8J3W1D5_9ACTN|nr:ATP-binding protein [Sphaerimonospora thailandensis]GIH72065.1 hypothetical protein Mth01_43180 [Sphaerimonospora thailandensis]
MDTAIREKPPLPYGQFSLHQRFSSEAMGPIRHQVAAHLRLWEMSALVEQGMLVASELCSNVRHAGDRRFELRMVLLNGRVRLEVRDYSTALPYFPAEVPAPDAVSGRGLYLVAELAEHVGVDLLGDGKIIWAVLGPGPCLTDAIVKAASQHGEPTDQQVRPSAPEVGRA